MRHVEAQEGWVPVIERDSRPIYLAITDAIARDIASGRLSLNDRLPSHRALGEALGVDFTTVTRAYTEARQRGLIEGRAGQGTYVCARPPVPEPPLAATVDMSMNLPPRFDNPGLLDRMWRDIGAFGQERRLDLLLDYGLPGGSAQDRDIAALWLRDRLAQTDPAQIVLTAGTQGAMFALFGALLQPGGTVLSAALTYPGMLSVARQLRLNCVGLAMDDQGITPDALETACRDHPGAVLYCNPTLHNPTTATMSHERRVALVAIARRHGIAIVEDDAYGALVADAPVALRVLAPELVYYIAGLSKCVSPTLRLAHVVLPDAAHAALRDVTAAIRATSSGVSSLTTAIAANWISSGIADEIRDAIRTESHARHELGRKILPAVFAGHPRDAFHVWLPLPPGFQRAGFAARLRSVGVGVVQSDAFALSTPPEAVRLSLGAARSRAQLEHALTEVRAALDPQSLPEHFVV